MRRRRIILVVALTAVALGAALVVALRRTGSAPARLTRPYRAEAIVGARTPQGWRETRATLTVTGAGRTMTLAAESQPGTETGCPPEAGLDREALRGAYDVVERQGPEVAGRATTEVRVTRRGAALPSLILHRDVETGAVLRRRSFRYDGSLASTLDVTSIVYLEGAPPAAAPPLEAPTTAEEVEARAGFAPVRPSRVPAGYRAQGLYASGPGNGRGAQYAEFRYTDGLRTLSVYQRVPGGWAGAGQHGRGRGPGGGRGGPPELSRVEIADQGIALSARQRRGKLMVVVVGDVSPDEAVAVLESIPPQ